MHGILRSKGKDAISSPFIAVLLCGAAALPGMAEEAKGIPESSITHNFPDKLDSDGRRAALARRGITYGINYYGEVFGNVDGGIKDGGRYFGMLETILDVDFEKLAGWRGLTFRASAFQLHGRGISANHVGLLNPVSNIEAAPATRLSSSFSETGRLMLRLPHPRSCFLRQP